MEDILVPIFICVVLPVSIVLIVFGKSMYSDKKRTQVVLKAIEANPNVDAEKLARALGTSDDGKKTPQERLNGRLLRGCIFTLIGIGSNILGLVTRYSEEGADLSFADDPVFFPLLLGGISLAIGISFLVVFFFSRKMVDREAHGACNDEHLPVENR